MALRILGVEISLDQAASITSMSRISSDAMGKNTTMVNPSNQKIGKTSGTETIKEKKPSAAIKPERIISITQESW